VSKKMPAKVLLAFVTLIGSASLATASFLQPPPAQASAFKTTVTARAIPMCYYLNLLCPNLGPTDPLEKAVFLQINNHRASLGLSQLVWNETIAAQARQHSQNMANKQVPLGHDGLSNRVTATKLPYSWYGENVVYNYGYTDPATQGVQWWLNSPGHRANIERAGYNLTGIGASKNAQGEVFFTQIFLQSP
jgi:uncharacterized protein YkwD